MTSFLLAAPAALSEEESAPPCAEFLDYSLQQKIGFVAEFDMGEITNHRDEIAAIEAYCADNPDASIEGARADATE